MYYKDPIKPVRAFCCMGNLATWCDAEPSPTPAIKPKDDAEELNMET
jgi:hypothetical protein